MGNSSIWFDDLRIPHDSTSTIGYYRWRKEYGGLNMTQAKKLKELEKENARLKTLVADLSLDNAIIKEVLSKK
jgi:cell division protein FtsB